MVGVGPVLAQRQQKSIPGGRDHNADTPPECFNMTRFAFLFNSLFAVLGGLGVFIGQISGLFAGGGFARVLLGSLFGRGTLSTGQAGEIEHVAESTTPTAALPESTTASAAHSSLALSLACSPASSQPASGSWSLARGARCIKSWHFCLLYVVNSECFTNLWSHKIVNRSVGLRLLASIARLVPLPVASNNWFASNYGDYTYDINLTATPMTPWPHRHKRLHI